jgi:hypothetical protein
MGCSAGELPGAAGFKPRLNAAGLASVIDDWMRRWTTLFLPSHKIANPPHVVPRNRKDLETASVFSLCDGTTSCVEKLLHSLVKVPLRS